MKEPKIRFNEFNGEWETDKIGNFSSSFSGGTPTAGVSEYYGGEIPFIRSGEIHADKTELFLTEKGYNNSSAKIVDKGTLLYALYGATSGDVAISKIKGAINQAILAITPYKSVEKEFLANFLLCNKDKIVGELLQGGQGNLSGSLVKDINVTYPSLAEQHSIASFFTTLDAQISASTSRLASLKQIKAASLQAMFPQEGETVPKLRFKGFEGEWEKVKLSDCLEISNERNLNNEFGINEVLSVSDEEGVMNQIKLLGRSYAGKSVTNYKVLRTYQVVYTKSPLKAKPYGIVKVNKGEIGIVSVLYAVYDAKDGVSPDYIHYYFEPTFRINNYLLPLINKGAKNTMNISDETSLQGNIVIPKTIDEQCKIVEYFQSLDRQITLQSQRLEKLKQIKAACLDKMFV